MSVIQKHEADVVVVGGGDHRLDQEHDARHVPTCEDVAYGAVRLAHTALQRGAPWGFTDQGVHGQGK